MKHILLLSAVLFSLTGYAQSVEKVINLPTTGGASPTRPSLIYYPDDYNSTSTKYPLLVFLHGSGEAGTSLAKIYNSSTAGGPAYLIEHGGWPSSFTNPSDKKAYKFIVVSPQSNNSWSSSGDETENMIKYLVANYRVDVNRIYITGLSAGGGAAVEYAAHLNGDENSLASTRTYLAAAIVPMSAATLTPKQSWADKIVGDNVKTWGLGDPNNDTYGENTMNLVNYINKDKAGYGIFSPNSYGHGGWNKLYIPSFKQTINGVSMNIYEWMLTNTRGGSAATPPPSVAAPTVSAGSSPTITLPIAIVTLTGSATAASGHKITSYAWTQTSGTGGLNIQSPTGATTVVSQLIAGTFVFQLKVTQDDGQTATSSVTVTVKSAATSIAPPTVNPGSSQTITLPVTTATLSGSGSAAPGTTIRSYAWKEISGPNTAKLAHASSAVTSVSGLIQGTYTFRLTDKQSDGQTSAGTATVTVNAAAATPPPPPTGGGSGSYASPTAAVSANQTLAVNSANLTSSDKISGSTLSSILWSKFSVPGQKKLKIGILGSSTAAGSGPTTYDSAFAGRLLSYYKAAGIIDSVVNLAYSGFNPYQAMPTGYVPSASINAKLSPSDTPWVNHNITAMLQHKPDVVILCFPSNGFDVLTMAEIMLPLQTIYNICQAQGIPCYVTTSQPRTDDQFSQTKQAYLQVIRDSILNRFGTHAIDFYDAVTVPGTTQQMPAYYGDGIHLNDAAHAQFFNLVVGANIFQSLISSSAVIGTPTAQNTPVTNLPNGVSKFQVSVRDAHGQVANAVTTVTVNAGSTAPVASAGSNQTITLPVNSVTLTGNASTGTISSYTWTRVSGPNTPTIVSPSAASTNVTGLVAGTYQFKLSLNNGAASGQVTITVNAAATAPTVVANAGGSQIITLPASSATLSGSASTGAITSYAWTKVSGPNTPTIVSPSAASTNVTGLIAGTYQFKLSLNNGAVSSLVTITVSPAVVAGPCKGKKYIIAPDPVDKSVYITHTNSSYQPGDTLVLNSTYSAVDIEGLTGTSSCPIVIMNQGVQAMITKRLNLDGCQYVKVTGSGSSAQYGIMIQQDPQLRQQSYYGIQINDKSRDVEVERVYMHNVDIGIVCETNESCDNSMNYPNWILDSMSFHDNKIVGTWNEGMYIGNTSPDNASYDLRPVTCNGVTSYPAPMKNGYTKIYNNIVDSTGRGGIQLANAAYGVSEIYSNKVSHNGMNGDDAQGTAISVGLYTRAYIHDNTISCTYTWGIASIGAGATNVPLRIENNTIDSSGYLKAYDLATTSRIVYDPRTEPTVAAVLTWPQSIEIDTRTRLYTTDSPNPGTAVKGQDSTQFYIIGNTIGLKKNTVAINVDDDYSGLQKNGNEICGNTNKGSGTAAKINVVSGIAYSTNCAGVTGAAVTRASSAFAGDSLLAEEGKGNSLVMSPNPARELVTITINNSHTGVMNVQLVDPSGVIRQNLQLQKDQSYSQVSLRMNDLPAGLYFVRVQVGSWIRTGKLLKL
jgi:predicted esterase